MTLICTHCQYPFESNSISMVCQSCSVAEREHQLESENFSLRGDLQRQREITAKYQSENRQLKSVVDEQDNTVAGLNKQLAEVFKK